MRNTLLIHMTDSRGQRVRWLSTVGAGEGLSAVQEGSISEAAADANGRRVVVLVPSMDVLLTHAKVPSKNRQRVEKAVPYALEEQLAGDIEDSHFALGAPTDDDYPVAVVSHDQMEAWLEVCTEAGLQPDVLMPDLLALPQDEEHWGVLVQHDYAVVRTGTMKGFACEQENLVSLLPLMTEAELPELIPVSDCGAMLEAAGFRVQSIEESRDALQYMAEQLAQGIALNLLQGPYSRREQLSRLWRPWRVTAALLAAQLVVVCVYYGIQYYRLGKEQTMLSAKTEEVFRAALPDVRKMVNPRAQMEQRLKALQGSGGSTEFAFLAMVEQAGPALRGTNGVEVQGANYRDGQLDLELTVDNLQLLDQLKQSLSNNTGLVADIQSATADADRKVKSRLRISGVGS